MWRVTGILLLLMNSFLVIAHLDDVSSGQTLGLGSTIAIVISLLFLLAFIIWVIKNKNR